MELLSAIAELQEAIHRDGLSPSRAIALIAQQAQELTCASGAAVAFLEGNELLYTAAFGDMASVKTSRDPLRAAFMVACIRERKPALCSEVAIGHHGRHARIRLAVPFYRRQEVAGVLELRFDAPKNIRSQELAACQLICGLLSQAIERTDNPAPPNCSKEWETALRQLETLTSQWEQLAVRPKSQTEKAETGQSPAAKDRTLPLDPGNTDRVRACEFPASMPAECDVPYDQGSASAYPLDEILRAIGADDAGATTRGPAESVVPFVTNGLSEDLSPPAGNNGNDNDEFGDEAATSDVPLPDQPLPPPLAEFAARLFEREPAPETGDPLGPSRESTSGVGRATQASGLLAAVAAFVHKSLQWVKTHYCVGVWLRTRATGDQTTATKLAPAEHAGTASANAIFSSSDKTTTDPNRFLWSL